MVLIPKSCGCSEQFGYLDKEDGSVSCIPCGRKLSPKDEQEYIRRIDEACTKLAKTNEDRRLME